MVLLLRPEILYARKKPDAAAQRLQEIIFEKPDNYNAWEKLLFIYLELKDYKNLQEKAEICSTKFNRSFTAKILYASAATENKDFPLALEELRKAEILAGEDKDMMLQVLSLRSDIYYRMNDYSKAFSTFDEALKYNRNDLTVLNNYAYYLAEQNMRLKEAEEMARKVVQTEKSNATFLDTYAWVLYKRGKNNEALKVMETIMNTSGVSDAEYYEHLGYMLKKKKEYEEAIKNWNTALKIDPTKTNLLKEIESCQKPR
jgi:Tfp pilus assembly protein PilF